VTARPPVDLPTDGPDPDRYLGRPLLILFENYVLAAIGALDSDKDERIPPAVQRVFGGGPDWKATLRSELRLPDTLDASIRAMWVKNQAIARDNAITLSAVQFARMFVDTNFPVDRITQG
jgi:hypothetical protein